MSRWKRAVEGEAGNKKIHYIGVVKGARGLTPFLSWNLIKEGKNTLA